MTKKQNIKTGFINKKKIREKRLQNLAATLKLNIKKRKEIIKK